MPMTVTQKHGITEQRLFDVVLKKKDNINSGMVAAGNALMHASLGQGVVPRDTRSLARSGHVRVAENPESPFHVVYAAYGAPGKIFRNVLDRSGQLRTKEPFKYARLVNKRTHYFDRAFVEETIPELQMAFQQGFEQVVTLPFDNMEVEMPRAVGETEEGPERVSLDKAQPKAMRDGKVDLGPAEGGWGRKARE